MIVKAHWSDWQRDPDADVIRARYVAHVGDCEWRAEARCTGLERVAATFDVLAEKQANARDSLKAVLAEQGVTVQFES